MEKTIQKYLFDPTIGKLVALLVGIGIIWTIIKILQNRFFGKIQPTTNRYRARKFASFTGYVLTIMLATVIYSDRLGGFTVALGVAGAGIAFALQEVIASAAGWLAVMFGGFYQTGDRVQLGGIKGDVIDIGVLRTTLMEIGQWVDGDLYNGRIVRIANSFVFKEPVFNYSSDFPFLWDEVKIPIQYGSDYILAEKIIMESVAGVAADYTKTARETWAKMVDKYMIEAASTEPTVTMAGNDNWVEYTCRFTVDFKKRRSTKDLIFRNIVKGVESSAGKVRLASATFELVGMPEIKVDVARK